MAVISSLLLTLATHLYLGRNEFQAALYHTACSQQAFLKATWLVAGTEDASQHAKDAKPS